jgi:two-component system cell cycle response regulator
MIRVFQSRRFVIAYQVTVKFCRLGGGGQYTLLRFSGLTADSMARTSDSPVTDDVLSMRILIADDNSVSRRILEASLKKWDFDVVSVADGKAAWDVLQHDDAPRLAILDWEMPERTGPEVCSLVRHQNREAYTYILLLTSKNEKKDLIEGMNAGADDYIAKPFDQQELRVRLRAGQRIINLQDDLLVAREALRQQATHDSLTGLKNRGTIVEMLNNEISRWTRHHEGLGVVILDLDLFKTVNDTYGHAAGDAVLKECARRMVSCTRLYDAVGRYGGEEFLVVLPGCDDSCTLAQAERLLQAIGSEPVEIENGRLHITASIGATSMAPGVSADKLIQIADDALYRAKRNGRNRVELISAASCLAATSIARGDSTG